MRGITPSQHTGEDGASGSSSSRSGCATPHECATMVDAMEEAMRHAAECTPGEGCWQLLLVLIVHELRLAWACQTRGTKKSQQQPRLEAEAEYFIVLLMMQNMWLPSRCHACKMHLKCIEIVP